jgi:NAD-dependent SIR2 family protein deacetylase
MMIRCPMCDKEFELGHGKIATISRCPTCGGAGEETTTSEDAKNGARMFKCPSGHEWVMRPDIEDSPIGYR